MENDNNWRYVIYARKSTDEVGKQARSIGDQINDCRKIVIQYHLNVIGEPIVEKMSAKKPGRRPLFKQMLKDIKSGKIDGIISWHPDRLARNMIEAGQIIDMLDSGIIKDLKFVSHQFSNDANGKMLLGMLFVFAKHYSDDLSSKVTRGMRGNFSDGKSSGTPKYGYIRDDNGEYKPDGENFKLMQSAWKLRANGKTIVSCMDYLNENGFSKFSKRDREHKPITVNESSLSKVFQDPFYYGVLNQANQTVDMRNLPVSFMPMIDESTYSAVQMLSSTRSRGPAKKKAMFLPLRGLVYCDVCKSSQYMTVSKSRGRLGQYFLYYSCKNKDCPRKPRGMRAKYVFNSLSEILNNTIAKLPDEAYDEYLKEVKLLSDNQKVSIRNNLSSLRSRQKSYKTRCQDLYVSIGKIKDPNAVANLNDEIANLTNELTKISDDIAKYEDKLQKASLPPIDKDQFKNLIKNIANKFDKANLVQKDQIIREIFLNLQIDTKKVVSYHLKEPYNTLMKINEFSYGRGERI